MKLNSKSGATLAAAAATLFLAGSGVSTVSTSADAAAGQVHGRQRLQGRERLQGFGKLLQGPERLQGRGFLGDFRKGVRRHGRQVRQGLIGGSSAARARRCRALVVSSGGRNKFGRARNQG